LAAWAIRLAPVCGVCATTLICVAELVAAEDASALPLVPVWIASKPFTDVVELAVDGCVRDLTLRGMVGCDEVMGVDNGCLEDEEEVEVDVELEEMGW
jgi:hypothetical protein